MSPRQQIFSETTRWLVYLVIGSSTLVLSIVFLIMSLGYMQSGLVATSLLSALIGFTLLSGSLYVLKLSAYVYSVSRERGREERG